MADLEKVRLGGTTLEWEQRINGNFSEVENRKVDKQLKTGSSTEYKELTDNNFSDELKQKLDGVSEGAEANVIESISINGEDLPVTNKKASISGLVEDTTTINGKALSSDIVLKSSDIENDTGYLTKDTGVTSVNGKTGAVSDIATKTELQDFVPKTRKINNKTLDADINLKTSDLENDGDGTSHFVTQEEVDVVLNNIENLLDDKASLIEQNTFFGKQNINGELEVNSKSAFYSDISVQDSSVKILDTANDIVTTYGSGEITVEENGSSIKHVLTLPKETGTLLTNADFNLKHSKIQNEDSEVEKRDSWKLTDPDAKLSIYAQTENDTTGIVLERAYTGLKHESGFGNAEVTLSQNDVVLHSEDISGKSKSLIVTPTSAELNGKEIITVAGGTFENRPSVSTNGTSSEVALKSDLDNYVPTQSENGTYYSQITNENGQVSIRIFKNGDETDTQSFVINSQGITSTSQNISGDVKVQGNVEVTGTTYTKETETLRVEDNIIVTNAKGETLVGLSGLAIRKGLNETYGIVYDPVADSVKLGLGSLDADNKFTFAEGEGSPIAVRADSSVLVNDHIIKWDSATHKFIDSGKSVSDIYIDINNKVDKVEGKQLSTNDYDDVEKNNVALNTAARHTHSNKSILDYITASYTTEEKTKLAGLSNYDDSDVKNSISALQTSKQDKLTAGQNISITNNTISATDTKYTAGDNISISDNNVISATATPIDISQETGDSTTSVMSQKAVTDNLNNKLSKNMFNIYVGTVDAFNDADGSFGQSAQIYNNDGSYYDVRKFGFNPADFQQEGLDGYKKYSLAEDVVRDSDISDVVRTDDISDVLRTSNVVNTTGASMSNIMSQKAVTDELNNKLGNTDTTVVKTNNDQTISGIKTFSNYIKTPQVASVGGKGLVRYKEVEGKSVYGNDSTANVLMGNTDRPFYSKNGSDFNGAELALKSDVPTVNNGTLTIQKNGTNVATFSANQSANATANITVPTKVSELTNDSNYAVSSRHYKSGDSGRTAGTYTYYKLASFPTDNSGNSCSLTVDGRIGGWNKGNKGYLSMIISNRDGIAASGMIIGNADISLCDLVVYTSGSASSGSTATLYVKTYSWYAFDFTLGTMSGTADIYDGVGTTTTPSGTLQWSLSSAKTNFLQVTDSGDILKQGNSVATTSQIPTNYVTTNTAQTISGKKTFTDSLNIENDNPEIILKSNFIDDSAYIQNRGVVFSLYSPGGGFDLSGPYGTMTILPQSGGGLFPSTSGQWSLGNSSFCFSSLYLRNEGTSSPKWKTSQGDDGSLTFEVIS